MSATNQMCNQMYNAYGGALPQHVATNPPQGFNNDDHADVHPCGSADSRSDGETMEIENTAARFQSLDFGDGWFDQSDDIHSGGCGSSADGGSAQYQDIPTTTNHVNIMSSTQLTLTSPATSFDESPCSPATQETRDRMDAALTNQGLSFAKSSDFGCDNFGQNDEQDDIHSGGLGSADIRPDGDASGVALPQVVTDSDQTLLYHGDEEFGGSAQDTTNHYDPSQFFFNQMCNQMYYNAYGGALPQHGTTNPPLPLNNGVLGMGRGYPQHNNGGMGMNGLTNPIMDIPTTHHLNTPAMMKVFKKAGIQKPHRMNTLRTQSASSSSNSALTTTTAANYFNVYGARIPCMPSLPNVQPYQTNSPCNSNSPYGNQAATYAHQSLENPSHHLFSAVFNTAPLHYPIPPFPTSSTGDQTLAVVEQVVTNPPTPIRSRPTTTTPNENTYYSSPNNEQQVKTYEEMVKEQANIPTPLLGEPLFEKLYINIKRPVPTTVPMDFNVWWSSEKTKPIVKLGTFSLSFEQVGKYSLKCFNIAKLKEGLVMPKYNKKHGDRYKGGMFYLEIGGNLSHLASKRLDDDTQSYNSCQLNFGTNGVLSIVPGVEDQHNYGNSIPHPIISKQLNLAVKN